MKVTLRSKLKILGRLETKKLTHFIRAYADLATENGTFGNLNIATCNYELLHTTKVTLRSKLKILGRLETKE